MVFIPATHMGSINFDYPTMVKNVTSPTAVLLLRSLSMELINRFLKKLIRATCSPALQQRIRRFYLSRRVIQGKSHREPEMCLLQHLIRPGDVILDIGANVGAYTVEFASLTGPHGRVYSFEPVSATYDILTEVIHKGNLANVSSFHAALGAEAGHADILIPELGAFTGYYLAHLAGQDESGTDRSQRRERVELFTLDGLWKSGIIERADFIKCDVEGSELDVLRGGRQFIDSQAPGCLVEVSRGTSKAVFDLLKDLEYRSFVFEGKLIETSGYRDKEFSNYYFFRDHSPMAERVRKLPA